MSLDRCLLLFIGLKGGNEMDLEEGGGGGGLVYSGGLLFEDVYLSRRKRKGDSFIYVFYKR